MSGSRKGLNGTKAHFEPALLDNDVVEDERFVRLTLGEKVSPARS